MSLPSIVQIREVGPREGFQTLPQSIPTAQKLKLIHALGKTGVQAIEITSFVRPDRVPQMADAEELVAHYQPQAGVQYTALYLNKQGFLRAEMTGRLQNTGWIHVAASETFLARNNNTSLQAVLDTVSEWVTLFAQHKKPLQGLMLSTAFGCNYEGEVPSSKVLHILREIFARAQDAGGSIAEVCLADTMGWATPEQLKTLVAEVRTTYPELQISLHLHDTRGAGMANVYAGLQEGVTCFDASVGGIGGCPFAKGAAGNVPTEDVLYLCQALGIETGLNLEAYVQAAQLAEEIIGNPLPGKLYKTWRTVQRVIR